MKSVLCIFFYSFYFYSYISKHVSLNVVFNILAVHWFVFYFLFLPESAFYGDFIVNSFFVTHFKFLNHRKIFLAQVLLKLFFQKEETVKTEKQSCIVNIQCALIHASQELFIDEYYITSKSFSLFKLSVLYKTTPPHRDSYDLPPSLINPKINIMIKLHNNKLIHNICKCCNILHKICYLVCIFKNNLHQEVYFLTLLLCYCDLKCTFIPIWIRFEVETKIFRTKMLYLLLNLRNSANVLFASDINVSFGHK